LVTLSLCLANEMTVGELGYWPLPEQCEHFPISPTCKCPSKWSCLGPPWKLSYLPTEEWLEIKERTPLEAHCQYREVTLAYRDLGKLLPLWDWLCDQFALYALCNWRDEAYASHQRLAEVHDRILFESAEMVTPWWDLPVPLDWCALTPDHFRLSDLDLPPDNIVEMLRETNQRLPKHLQCNQ